ncbi:unnamed protein product [Owenia fusiformis]|uniref:Uncharacterized protein n=1 Tax=Owenia fusiformis TaxID=6347 RepID=A0A8J1T788_OWEFU|nr:unnamed protein product [Owenia fusiformis]
MSYTVPPRGSRSQVTRKTVPPKNANGDPADANAETKDTATNPQDRAQYMGGYTMITPNEKKRQQIQNQAKKEEQAYQKHKEKQKLGHVSYVGTVGGGENPAVPKTQTPNAKLKQSEKRQQYRQQTKDRETAELQKKKEAARKQAGLNTQRDKERAERLDEDRRKKNEAFLKRFDKPKRSQANKSDSIAGAGRQPEELGATNNNFSDDCDIYYNDGNPLVELQQRFPHCDMDYLEGLLLQCNGNVRQAMSLLT